MKEFYDTQIKPLNDKLGRYLEKPLPVVHIPVKDMEREYDVEVWVTFWSANQHKKVTFTNRQIRSFRALGLNI